MNTENNLCIIKKHLTQNIINDLLQTFKMLSVVDNYGSHDKSMLKIYYQQLKLSHEQITFLINCNSSDNAQKKELDNVLTNLYEMLYDSDSQTISRYSYINLQEKNLSYLNLYINYVCSLNDEKILQKLIDFHNNKYLTEENNNNGSLTSTATIATTATTVTTNNGKDSQSFCDFLIILLYLMFVLWFAIHFMPKC